MRFRYFNDRPKPAAVRLMATFDDVHVFVFHWGATVRWRRPQNFWRHATIFISIRHRDRGRGGMLTIGAWLTRDGVTERVPWSKKYLIVKVLV